MAENYLIIGSGPAGITAAENIRNLDKTIMDTPPRNYSPFWALIAVFLTFVLMQAASLRNVLQQRKNLLAAQVELQKIVPQALTINDTLEKLGRDLLSMTNKEARQIVADFKIAPR